MEFCSTNSEGYRQKWERNISIKSYFDVKHFINKGTIPFSRHYNAQLCYLHNEIGIPQYINTKQYMNITRGGGVYI